MTSGSPCPLAEKPPEKRFLTPAETTCLIAENGKRVLNQSLSRTLLLSLLAGVYIAFGAQLATIVTHDAAPIIGDGLARFVAGSVFSLGLMLVVICGAELFTGNSLLTKAALHGHIRWSSIWSNWTVVLAGNLVGSLFFAWLMFHSLLWEQGQIAERALTTAQAKVELSFAAALIRGILCNWLVCLAVFMATAARDVTGKILACYVPIMAFVASGFEHSIANMYFIPTGLLLAGVPGLEAPGLTWGGFLANIIPVTLGNIIGGVIFVGFAYWYIHLKALRTS
ncbi:formate/nitrite transporter family protein [Geoalkalibacter halelectricus]|uniref:Formate/nitrite transporter family protein n=1 Tax=Geoalkalibacter halelectricus TaxID=2847045 RepID=A0ABY5ZQ22_9BACT|nr:formate/nitrite transporter family protein [Geoalkalibacter halelectricus]MDO3378706.1 formate/nitrite transporter family protein [Geoalkalibacter halelectricus]UWZ79985.1 formate/nitrite transporter family protein [Geoalkalibacter halelectricus]